MILDHFRGTPRDVQSQALREIGNKWYEYDVFVVSAPVASGKSRIADCIASWQNRNLKSCAILTPNNILSQQYTEEMPWPSLMGKSHYPDQEAFKEAKTLAVESPTLVCNYWVYWYSRLGREVLIVDEAHNLINMLADTAGWRLDRAGYGFPEDLTDRADVIQWLGSARFDTKTKEAARTSLLEYLVTSGSRYTITTTDDELVVTPVTAQNLDLRFTFGRGKKIVLMSATIGPVDVKRLGLRDRRVCYIQCDSPIPPVNRPFVRDYVGPVSHKSLPHLLPQLAARINQLSHHHSGRGMIHCPYRVAELLRPYFTQNPRFIFHKKADKAQQFQKFRNTPGAILVGSGMYEGINLPFDAARWQAICKVPYPFRPSPITKELVRESEDNYSWLAIRDVIQATGRVCRAPTDYGVTYMLDANWRHLEQGCPQLIPLWFKTAATNIDIFL